MSPSSETDVNLYKDGSTTAIKSFSLTASDLGGSSTTLSEFGNYISGIGSIDTAESTNQDTQKSLFHPGTFGTLAFEFKEVSNFDFRVYNVDVQYTVTPTSQGAKMYTSKVYSNDTF
jgi:hypothetical protein